jgi:hypothetical protein
MEIEVLDKGMLYRKIHPKDEESIIEASNQERAGFETGLDPQEMPPVLKYIAEKGDIYLQYKFAGEEEIATGVMEILPLEDLFSFDPSRIDSGEYDLSLSPLTILSGAGKNVFRDLQRFSNGDVLYHHGIAMSEKGKGYGTLLLDFVLKKIVMGRVTVVCFIDAADNETLLPNEISFVLHTKKGFVLAGVVDPPVYDQKITYYLFVRPRKKMARTGGRVFLNLAEGSARDTLEKVRELISEGYLGVSYSKETHEMDFVRF